MINPWSQQQRGIPRAAYLDMKELETPHRVLDAGLFGGVCICAICGVWLVAHSE